MRITAVLAVVLVASVTADGHDWEFMNKGMFGLFSFDFINNKLEVKTESMVQNSKLLAMTWDNEKNDVMGPIYVTVMSGTVMYQVVGCYNDNQQMLNLASDENFLTSETKIWSFARYEDRIEIMCDGKLLITISFKEECQELWSSVPIAVTFQAMDSASTSYRAEPKEGDEYHSGEDSGAAGEDGAEDSGEDGAAGAEGSGGCVEGEVPCESGDQCILRSWICDGETDCSDGSDEAYWRNCEDGAENGNDDGEAGEDGADHTDDSEGCGEGKVYCDSGDQCIFRSWICDGESDCNDGSDEAYWRNCEDHENMSAGTRVWGNYLVVMVTGLVAMMV